MEEKILSLDSTILNTLQGCDLKYDYNFEKNLRLPFVGNAIEEGSLMHIMLEVYYALIGSCAMEDTETWITIKEQGLYSDLQSLYNLMWEDKVRFAKEVGQYYATKLELLPDDASMVMFQFGEYCEHYHYDTWHPLAVEEVGCKELYEDNDLQIIYNFKVDLVAEQGKLIIPWDHKTSSKRQEPTTLSNQFIGYCFGLSVNHILINKIGFQKTLSRAERFQRFTLTIDQARINEWKLNSAYWAILHLAMEEQDYERYFPKLREIKRQIKHPIMNLTSCDKYSGCTYKEICSASPDSRQRTIDREFVIGKVWDVGKILEVKK